MSQPRNDPSRLVAAVLAAAPVAGAVTACGSNDKVNTGAAAPRASMDAHETLDHEDCSESGNRVEMLDTNNDGKPDIRRVFDKQSGRELCRVADLNHDGRPDLYEYFDASGAVRRREFCYDDTGTVNAIEYYENGRLAKRAYDTSGRQKSTPGTTSSRVCRRTPRRDARYTRREGSGTRPATDASISGGPGTAPR